MKETIAHILEVVVVVIALFAVIAIITMMTELGDGTRDAATNDLTSGGVITRQIDSTINKVFDKTAVAIDDTADSADADDDEGEQDGDK
jgi:hypothetical protein